MSKDHFALASDATRAIAGQKSAVHSGVPYHVALRQGHYKYVRYLAGDEPEELYDLEADPEELTNRAAEPEYHSLREQFRGGLLEELRRCEAGFIDLVRERGS